MRVDDGVQLMLDRSILYLAIALVAIAIIIRLQRRALQRGTVEIIVERHQIDFAELDKLARRIMPSRLPG